MNKIVTTPRSDSTVEVGSPVEQKITVLNPVGYPPKVNKKALAPRPESLDGKTIYLVDCRFDDFGRAAQAGAGLVRRAHAGGEDQDDLALGHLSARRSQDLGRDQGERRCRHRRRRPLQQLRAGGRHPRHHARDQVRRADGRAPHRQVRPRRAVGDQDGRPAGRAARLRAAAGDGQDHRGAARIRLRQGPDHRPAGDAGGHRGAHHRAERAETACPTRQYRRRSSVRRRVWSSPTPKTISSGNSSRTTGPTGSRSSFRPRSASPEMLAAHQPQARRGRRPHAADRVPRRLGIHRREGGGERGDGRRQAGILPGHPGARGLGGLRARLDLELVRRRWWW